MQLHFLRRILCLLVRGYLPASKATIQKREQARKSEQARKNRELLRIQNTERPLPTPTPPNRYFIPSFTSPPLGSRDYDEVFEKKVETMVIGRPSDEARKNRA